MLKEERQSLIMKEINLHNKVLSTDLSQLLNVSEDTIRRDLKELADSGKVVKVHGGAISRSYHYPFRNNSEVYALEAKKAIAQKAVKLIESQMVVLTGGGTTMIEFAKSIPADLKATFFTLSPLMAIELIEHPNITVITLGGRLSKNAHVNIGASVINELAGIRADLCIMGSNSISAEHGITESDWEVVQVKKAMIRSSHKLAIVSISEKLNSTQRLKVCDMNQVNYLITELPSENSLLQPYQHLEVKLP